MVKKKIKKWQIILLAITSAIIIAGVIFFQFTPVGYCMAIRFRDFTEVENNIFIHNDYIHVTENDRNELVGKDGIPALIDEARSRVADLFGGELHSDPVFVISDNRDIIRKIGDRHTYSFTLHRVYSYIILSHRFVNVDIIAHEITHTELYYRVMNGRPFRFMDNVIPVWFNEGLASISDYRDIMSEDEYLRRKENGLFISEVTSLTRADFRKNHVNDSTINALVIQEFYLMSKFEVKAWLDKNGVEGLLLLIDGIRAGKDFHDLYHGVSN